MKKILLDLAVQCSLPYSRRLSVIYDIERLHGIYVVKRVSCGFNFVAEWSWSEK